jgi:hypothetical protein
MTCRLYADLYVSARRFLMLTPFSNVVYVAKPELAEIWCFTARRTHLATFFALPFAFALLLLAP